MNERAPTPQELVQRLLAETEHRNVAQLARASGWNYQRVLRWSNGTSGDIPQDDMAELLLDLELEYQQFGVRPTKAWRDKHARKPRASSSALDEQARHDLTIMATRIEAMERNIIALCVKFGVETTTPEGIHA